MPSRSTPRVLAVGLDSVDRGLLMRLVGEGRLPHLAELLASGRFAPVRSPPGLGDDAVWASFSSGLPPGRHARFFWQRLWPGRYDMTGHRDDDSVPPPFWDTLARAGRRVAVIDVPKSPMVTRDGCVQLCDWLVHGRDGPTRSHPADLAVRILEAYGDDRIDRPGTDDFLCGEHALPPDLHDEFLHRLHAGLEAKGRAVGALLDDGPWDLFLVVFKEGHCAGHEFWSRVGQADDPVADTYARLDAVVGELLARVDDDTHVLVFSGLGMAENHTAEHLLDRALLRLEPHLSRLVADAWPRLAALEDRIRRRWRPDRPTSVARSLRTAYQVPHNELA
ncbi:MAG: alkaline phosphatase family protein, partial [Longimicrobiales bacterium]